LGFIVAEYFAPEEINWDMSFSKNDKIPFGSYILFHILQKQFSDDYFIVNDKSLYEFFEINQPLNTNFIFCTYSFLISETELDKILKYVKIGNNVFLSASEFSQNITDSLKFKTSYNFYSEDSIYLKLVNPSLYSGNYMYKKAFEDNFFYEFDTLNTMVLGKNNSDEVNFIKVKYGNGNFFINIEPLAFTNYNLLVDKNYEYSFKALSYLDLQKTYWDEFYKPGNVVNSSPLVIIFKSRSFKTGYYLALISLMLYFIFMGKRKQRVIPIINPLANTSLEFTEIIARLYLHKKNHKDIALKRFKYFLEFLRAKYGLKVNEQIVIDAKLIANKTGTEINIVEKIFSMKIMLDNETSISEDFLYQFNKAIEDFYSGCK